MLGGGWRERLAVGCESAGAEPLGAAVPGRCVRVSVLVLQGELWCVFCGAEVSLPAQACFPSVVPWCWLWSVSLLLVARLCFHLRWSFLFALGRRVVKRWHLAEPGEPPPGARAWGWLWVWALGHWVCWWTELPQLPREKLMRMGKKGRRQGLREKEEEEGKSFARRAGAGAGAGAALGPWLRSHARGPVAGVVLCFLWLLA